jgi:hypothetical protein
VKRSPVGVPPQAGREAAQNQGSLERSTDPQLRRVKAAGAGSENAFPPGPTTSSTLPKLLGRAPPPHSSRRTLDAVRLNWSATAQMDCMFAGDDADAACTLRSRRPISRPLPTRSAAERTPTCHSTDTSSAQLLGRRPSLRLPCDLLDSSADTSTYISLGG